MVFIKICLLVWLKIINHAYDIMKHPAHFFQKVLKLPYCLTGYHHTHNIHETLRLMKMFLAAPTVDNALSTLGSTYFAFNFLWLNGKLSVK